MRYAKVTEGMNEEFTSNESRRKRQRKQRIIQNWKPKPLKYAWLDEYKISSPSLLYVHMYLHMYVWVCMYVYMCLYILHWPNERRVTNGRLGGSRKWIARQSNNAKSNKIHVHAYTIITNICTSVCICIFMYVCLCSPISTCLWICKQLLGRANNKMSYVQIAVVAHVVVIVIVTNR